MGVLHLVAALALAKLFYDAIKWWMSVQILMKLPQPKAPVPLLGNIEFGEQNHHQILLKWSRELGGIFFLRVLWMKFVIVTDVDLANEVLRSGLDKAPVYKAFDRFNKNYHSTVFTGSTYDPFWHTVRKTLAPAFNTRNIKVAFQKLLPLCDQFVEVLYRKGPMEPIDIADAAQRLTIDEISILAFDTEVGSVRGMLEGREVPWLHDFKLALQEGAFTTANPLRPYLFFLPGVIRGAIAFRRCHKETLDLVKRTKAKGPVSPDDVSPAAHLLRYRDPVTKQPIPDDKLAAEFGALTSAGR
eukprot:jgi/Botrbrau1/6384/Bobra.49_1s0002.1